MGAHEVLQNLRARGLRIEADGDSLRIIGEPLPTGSELAELRARKQDLLQALAAEGIQALVLDLAPGRDPLPCELLWLAFDPETAAELEVMEKRFESFSLPVRSPSQAGLTPSEGWRLRQAAASMRGGAQRVAVTLHGRAAEVLGRWPPGPRELQ